jgi:hypothetical protein
MMVYPGEDDEDDAEDHTRMYLPRQAVKNIAYRVYRLPEDEHDDAALGHDVKDLVVLVDRVQHGYVQRS